MNIGGVRQLASTKMKGVIVSINDAKNNFQVLTDAYEKVDCETKNTIMPSDEKMNKKLEVNEIRITPIDGFVVANIPNKDTYNSGDELRKQLQDFNQFAFIIQYNDPGEVETKYKAMYYDQNLPTKNPEYVFNLDKTNKHSYLMYMLFLASYQFVSQHNNNFALNDESPYNLISILNSIDKSNSSIIRMAGYYATQLLNKNLISQKNIENLLDDVKKIDKNKNINELNKNQLPFIQGGSSKRYQKGGGGGWDELTKAFKEKSINLSELEQELNDDISLINKKDADGNTLLMIACQEKADLKVVELLLEMGAQGSINAQNVVGNTALHYACSNNLKNIAQLLVKSGADLSIKNLLGKTPIDLSTDPMLKSILKLHVENVKNMFRFVENNRLKDIQTLLKTFRNLNIVNSTTGNTPLHIACKNGIREIAELLLQYGADPDIVNNANETPFDLIAGNNNKLRTDLENQYKNTTELLAAAAAGKDLDSIKRILSGLGADKKLKDRIINSRNNFKLGGRTPLILATTAKAGAIVKYLLENGADVDATDKYETTPLHYACKEGNESIARTLVRAGANLDAKDVGRFDGKTYVRYTPLNVCKTNELRLEILKAYFEKLVSDKKLKFPKRGVLTEESIKKALNYYIRNPHKLESKNSYYVVIDVHLYPGTSISKAQRSRMRCAGVWENVREAWADLRGNEYVPNEFTIKSLVPNPVVAKKSKPIARSNMTRRRWDDPYFRGSNMTRRRRGGSGRRNGEQAKKTRKRGKHGA